MAQPQRHNAAFRRCLTRLAALEPTESNIDHVNAIRKMALACRLPLQDFLSKLEKYDATMSPFATGSSFRSTGKKVRYALSMAEEVKTVRAMISGKVISINLLLATHASESLSRNEERLSANQESIISRLEEAKDGMSRIRQDIDRMDATANTSREELRKETARSTCQLIEQLKKVEKVAESTDQSVSSLNNGAASISASLTRLGDLGIQALTIMRALPAELRTLLRTILQTNMQMYTVLLDVHRKIAAPPTLALESNIRVEDALGEIRSLPFEWFRHWEPFEGLPRAEFKDRLGAERVERGDFRLVHARRPTISIDKSNWSQTITAGSDILMLMYLSGLACQDSACPRQSCNGQTPRQAQSNTMLTCPECGLRFIPQPIFSEGTEAKTIEQLQIEEDVRLFGSRDGPYVSGISELYPREISTNGDAEELEEDVAFAERGEPSTRYSSKKVHSSSEQKTLESHEGHDSITNDSSEPPIYAWLADTEPQKILPL
ncbi:hypothetical protein FB567DRAFT_632317 [Paraphoma chrysanthemicola]|uniref:Ubiquitin-like domain-containing protein n=1 Tax=Paraphoma chrysanthemicola TaxID=798071 RepID=A0A8K0VTL1_9PLEO|nr:hypothetical protein FB567DRAFT_632317 [Paraphoma chrysanthemicola]